MKRHIYIDLGCYDGDSVLAFMANLRLPVAPHLFEVYAFDPNPNFKASWRTISKLHPNVRFERSAAYNRDGKAPYSLHPTDDDLGSSIIPAKNDWGHGKLLQVKCFDFSHWLQEFAGAFIIVKLDVEGAEFDILEKMVADGTDQLVGQFWIEWHDGKLEPPATKRRKALERVLKGRWREWV